MIYAKVDVKLRDHARAQRAGAAMSTWTWGLLYAREQESDGYVPEVAIRGAWVSEGEARKHAAKLVEVGLWERDEAGPDGGGWRICRYSEKNETRSDINARRAEATERMRRVRANKQRTDGEHPPHVRDVNSGAVPGCGYGSGSSSSESRSEDPTSSPRAIPPAPPSWPHNDIARGSPPCAAVTSVVELPPAWWLAACDTVAANVAPVDERGARWLEYEAHRAGKNIAPSQRDAVGWLSQVVRRERREPRRKVDTRQPLTGPEPTWFTNAKTGTGKDPF